MLFFGRGLLSVCSGSQWARGSVGGGGGGSWRGGGGSVARRHRLLGWFGLWGRCLAGGASTTAYRHLGDLQVGGEQPPIDHRRLLLNHLKVVACE